MPDQNWNQLWESNFQPVYIEDKIQVRASFHEPKAGYLIDILIDPKMSFGTGHHETTQMMMQSMLELDFTQKKVLDFGAGTGILSVLAEKLGASQILAVDYDPWCIASINENVALNACKAIEANQSDSPPVHDSFDIILANINKNVLLEHAELLTSLSISSGFLILSGLLSNDYEDISSIYSRLWEKEYALKSINNWISIVYTNKKIV
jgi:ribosomal protein L11 methyltransferase